VRQLRVSQELRELRRKAGMTCAEVATALGTSITKISRMETGERGLYADDVSALLGLYRVPASYRDELLDLIRNGADPNWWQLKSLPNEWRDLIALESEAQTIANFEPLLIPGLLQTAEYTTTIISCTDPSLLEKDRNSLVATRMARQGLLTKRNAPTLHAIVDEMVLHRPIGEPGVLKRQLQHLLTCAQRTNVTVQVLPLSAGANPGLDGPLIILDLDGGRSVVHLETRRAGAFLSEEPHVKAAKIVWQRLRAMAMAADRSARLIAGIESEMPR
jgi:transcriptional regulator with XRE-family HTH domain